MAHQLAGAVQEELGQSLASIRSMVADHRCIETVAAVAELCSQAIANGNKVMFAGNGGSAADAQHLAGEFVSRFNFDRNAIAGLALTTDTSVLTSIGNDYGYEYIFSRQVEALGRPGDIFVGITTSGRSSNILRALDAAKEKGVVRVGLTGLRGEGMAVYCDRCIIVPVSSTPRVQELHIALGHTICALVERSLFGQQVPAVPHACLHSDKRDALPEVPSHRI